MTTNQQTEQWGIFELSLTGSAVGNPFLDVQFSAHFSYKHRTIEVDGFLRRGWRLSCAFYARCAG